MSGAMLHSVSFTRAALADAFREDDDGVNVVYHELAHVLDAADGVCDGIPLLLDPHERVILVGHNLLAFDLPCIARQLGRDTCTSALESIQLTHGFDTLQWARRSRAFCDHIF